MTTVASATTWGSPTATKHALLIHGLTGSSLTWHRIASSLAAQGYLVTAPNLIGHVSRVAPDYHINAIANDLRPYLETRTYSLIIGHSLGGATALHLLPYLPRSHPTAIVLVDPPLNMSLGQIDFWEGVCTKTCMNVNPLGAHGAERPLWTHEENIYRDLAARLCAVDTVHAIFTQNRPWNFLDRLKDVSDKWKVSVLLADPAICRLCPVEDLHPYSYVRSVIVPGAGHCVQCEFPNVIVEEALKRVDELDVLA